jgi:HEAT repeat protein
MTSSIRTAARLCILVWGFSNPLAGEVPDLTKDLQSVDRKLTYNLGATGLRGWIHTKAANNLDAAQGRTTTASRQILVTHVGANSPADGVVNVDDIILGVDGKPFDDDARKGIALAIQEAETEAKGGILKLTVSRAGQVRELTIKLEVLGTYSDSAPWDCAKSKLIFNNACKVLEKEPMRSDWTGSIQGLALLATGNPEHLPKLQEFARSLASAEVNPDQKPQGSVWGDTWNMGYRNLFLCEYFLVTRDREVLPAITNNTLALARGQSMYGTFGHGFAALTRDGKFNGSVPPYGPVNMAGLPANLSIVLGRMCGVKRPEVDQAIARAASYFGYYAGKGAIPYGEHEPWPYHENNGKNSITAVMFSAIGNKPEETEFFARMATAGYPCREYGHTGQGFSYLWSALGAAVGGPEAAAAFFGKASWHLDLVRRSDGSFTYDGGEQYGAGRTDDDTYHGDSGYYGLSPVATYVLTYALPLRKLVITGRGADESGWLDRKQAAATVAAGRFDLDRQEMTAEELVEAFGNWSPIVRSWAADELARRPEGRTMVASLIQLAAGGDPHRIQGACETLGLLNTPEALPVLVKQLAHPDRWVRYKSAAAIRQMGGTAKPALEDILKALVSTAEPMSPIRWEDPVQFAQGQLAAAVFNGPLKDELQQIDPRLRYAAIRAVSTNPDGMARATLRNFFENHLSEADVVALAPVILAAVENPSPADTMFNNEIRMAGLKALAKYHFKEGIAAAVGLAKTQGGHGSESRTGEIMKIITSYGTAAKPLIPAMKEIIVMFDQDTAAGMFPPSLNKDRTGAVEDAIRLIEAATTQPELRSTRR